MNRRRVFGAVLLVVMMLLVSVVPASAGATKTPFTGTCDFLPEPPSPDVKTWYSHDNVLHMRDEIQAFSCDFSDDRLDGTVHAVVNMDVLEYTDPYWYVVGHDYGRMVVMDDDGNVVWEGFRNTWDDAFWEFSGDIILQGRGPNKGLQARMDVWGDFKIAPVLNLAGEILDPGKVATPSIFVGVYSQLRCWS